jgi:GNAT superfamily N-acetyltransferase
MQPSESSIREGCAELDPGSAAHHSAALHAAPHPGNGRLIRAADSEQDVVAIHRFLCRVAPPVLHCPINAGKSLAEVQRVVTDRDYGFAFMAFAGADLVGTIGAIFVPWWYGDDHFFTDRWFFTLPGCRWAGPRLLAEADAVARDVGVPLIVNLKQRRTTAAVTFVQPLLLGLPIAASPLGL